MTIASFYGLANNPYYVLSPNGAGLRTAPKTWLDYTHPDWDASVVKWIYARDVYTADVLDPIKIGSYLVKKKIGESEDSYSERQGLADFTSHFGVCVDALAGMLFNVEDDATRVFGELGVATDPNTIAGQLQRNADGKNTGYKTIWKQLAIELVITHCHWMLVTAVGNTPRVQLIEPERVLDWDEDADGLLWAKVCEEKQVRTGYQSEPNAVKQYVIFTRDGWQRYREEGEKGKETAAPMSGAGDSGAYSFVDAAGKKQLPIFRVSMPLRRNVGFPLAKKNVAIFNQESTRDQSVRVAGFAKLFCKADNDTFQAIAGQLADGSFAIQEDPNVSGGGNRFDTAPTAAAEIATKIVDQKIEHFYRSFFREYANTAGRDRVTATEVRQDVASGVGAFLQMLKAALDDGESQTLWRLERAVFPRDTAKWNQAKVERSSNFQPLNPDETIDRLKKRYFGETTPVPVDRAALKDVLQQILAWDGITLDDAALEAALDNHTLMQTKDLISQLPLPPALKAKLSVTWAERLGIGTDDVPSLEADATAIAEADQKSKDMMAQPFGPPAADATPPTPAVTNIVSDGQGGFKITKGQ